MSRKQKRRHSGEFDPLTKIIPDCRGLLANELPVEEYETIRRHERSGRALGKKLFWTASEYVNENETP